MTASQLVDGDSYTFRYRGTIFTGYYSAYDKGFYDNDGNFYRIGSCTNIQPA